MFIRIPMKNHFALLVAIALLTVGGISAQAQFGRLPLHAAQTCPQYRLRYELLDGVMTGKFEFRMPGQP